MPMQKMKIIIFSLLATLAGIGFTYNLIDQYSFNTTSAKPFAVSVSDIGTQMLSTTEPGFALPFEVVSMLLLAAMVGCIVIAMKPSNESFTDESIKQQQKNPGLTPFSNALNTPAREMEEISE
jgi:NADH-quinone oxidoreductase subunit J